VIMCGIVGYVGNRSAPEIILEGLKRLEYRGYDSSGIAVLDGDELQIQRSAGKLSALEEKLRENPLKGVVGVGHTRWATHGSPTEENAHPHRAGGVVVVHNGIIENYLELKEMLIQEGHQFQSETDTEVICHLIHRNIKRWASLEEAVVDALNQLQGSYALGILWDGDPQRIVAARKESPLVIGLGDDETFAASDVPAILRHTRRMIFLDDNEIAVLDRGGAKVFRLDKTHVQKEVQTIDWSPVMAEKGGYRHFMLKEIFEQPRAVIDSFRGRVFPETGQVNFGSHCLRDDLLKEMQRVVLVACGTSYHAGLVGKYMLEDIARIPVEVDLASEFRYRDPLVDSNTLLVAISQSGETADTLAALREGASRGSKTLAICNVVGSSLVRASDGVIYTQAGPEIGVASTKAFTTQLVVIYLLAIHLANLRGQIDPSKAQSLLQDLLHLPGQMDEILATENRIEEVARSFMNASDFLYLGRGINYPVALEGALKLKEISYIHAEGYPAGEMKHGPIALIDEYMPVVVLLNRDRTHDKLMGNIEEVKARKGKVIAVTSDPADDLSGKVDESIPVPSNNEYLTTIGLTLPLQLLAYHVAVLKGTDVDQPRNLAKSVTVE
jgi:glucosamine--fructose-6-phosphate aminotransferase (isomerizing)